MRDLGFSIPEILKMAGMKIGDIDLFEINGAFASQVLGNVAMLNLDLDCLNVHGGAIVLGHLTGCSGARIIGTLYYALKRLDKELGGRQFVAVVVRRWRSSQKGSPKQKG